MAYHPFRTFQRNQKSCMAAVTLLAIISFLFLGVIIQLLAPGGSHSVQTVADSRRFGKITNYDLERLRVNHENLLRFLNVLLEKLTVSAGADEMRRNNLIPLNMEVKQLERMKNPEQLVNVWLVTNHAQKEGISPQWEDVKNWLKRLTNDQAGNHLNAVYADAVRESGMTQRSVEALLVQHLCWVQSYERFEISVSAISPATRWSWFQRLFRQVTIEAAAVPVDSYVDQVGKPNTAQLNALFEQYKKKRYNPVSVESGFILPAELAYQYIIAEPTQELLDSITEEEMLAYYEGNKDMLFRKPTTPLPQIPGMLPGSVPFPPHPAGGLTPFALEGAPSLPDLPKVDDVPSESPPPAPIPEEPAAPTEPVNTENAPADETSAVSKVTTRLVSYQTEEAKEDMPDTGGLTPAAPNDVSAAPETPSATEEEATEKPVDLSILYRPFDEVKDEIREDLALTRAADRLAIIEEKVKVHAKLYNQHIEKEIKPPEMPDWTKFAAEQGFALVTVPMGNVYAAVRTDLARDSLARQHLFEMFQSLPLPFAPETFVNSTGRRGMSWVTDQKNELRPETIDQVKDMVEKRWKEIEARPLALEKAQELADEARKSGNSLAETLGSRMPVAETEQFTWQIFYPNFGRPIPGEVREKGVVAGNADTDNRVIIAPGNDFMAAVYSLQVGEIGVVFNQPKNRAYIVRITGSSPTDEALWERYQSFSAIPDMERIYMSAGFPEMYADAFEAWMDEIRSKTGFRWVNKPDVLEVYDE